MTKVHQEHIARSIGRELDTDLERFKIRLTMIAKQPEFRCMDMANQHQVLVEYDQKLDDAKLDATLPVGTTIADNPAIRFIDAGIDLNSIVNYETGQTMAEELGVALKPSDVNVETVFEQNKILKEVLSGDITAKTGQNRLNEIAKLKNEKQKPKVK